MEFKKLTEEEIKEVNALPTNRIKHLDLYNALSEMLEGEVIRVTPDKEESIASLRSTIVGYIKKLEVKIKTKNIGNVIIITKY